MKFLGNLTRATINHFDKNKIDGYIFSYAYNSQNIENVEKKIRKDGKEFYFDTSAYILDDLKTFESSDKYSKLEIIQLFKSGKIKEGLNESLKIQKKSKVNKYIIPFTKGFTEENKEEMKEYIQTAFNVGFPKDSLMTIYLTNAIKKEDISFLKSSGVNGIYLVPLRNTKDYGLDISKDVLSSSKMLSIEFANNIITNYYDMENIIFNPQNILATTIASYSSGKMFNPLGKIQFSGLTGMDINLIPIRTYSLNFLDNIKPDEFEKQELLDSYAKRKSSNSGNHTHEFIYSTAALMNILTIVSENPKKYILQAQENFVSSNESPKVFATKGRQYKKWLEII